MTSVSGSHSSGPKIENGSPPRGLKRALSADVSGAQKRQRLQDTDLENQGDIYDNVDSLLLIWLLGGLLTYSTAPPPDVPTSEIGSHRQGDTPALDAMDVDSDGNKAMEFNNDDSARSMASLHVKGKFKDPILMEVIPETL